MSERTTIDRIEEQPYEQEIVTAITEDEGGYWLELGHSGFYLAKRHGVEPKVGDTAYFYGDGIGRIVRGLALNGTVAFYRTPAEQAEENRRHLEAMAEQRRADFEAARDDQDRRIALLPEPFRRRLAYFGRTPEWRVEHEGYELFCCEQAVLIADTLGTVEEVRAFAGADWEEQLRRVPGLSDQHSGNSFGASVALARYYLTDPDQVPDAHGALVYLVGCEDYGCEHPRPWREEAAS